MIRRTLDILRFRELYPVGSASSWMGWSGRVSVVAWLTVLLLGLGLYLMLDAAHLRMTGDRVEGTVVGKVVHPRRGPTERAIYDYTYEGRVYRHRATVGDSDARPGDRAELLVDPDRPAHAVQLSDVGMAARIVLGFAVFGAVCTALLDRFLARRARREVPPAADPEPDHRGPSSSPFL